MTIEKRERELARKAKAQQKRQRKVERRKSAKAFSNPGATELSPLQNQEGAMNGDLRPHHLAPPGDNSTA